MSGCDSPKPPRPGEPGFVPPGGINCQQCTDFLLDYVEGALPAEQLRAFEAHTSVCRPCEIYLENYRRVTEMASKVGAEAPAEPPARIIEAILRARAHPHASGPDAPSRRPGG